MEPSELHYEQQQALDVLKQRLTDWLASERTGKGKSGSPARSTLAGAVVVIDKLRNHAPIQPKDIFTDNGQLIGGRGRSLRTTLARYGEERVFLQDGVTTRSTLKFEKLAKALEWGNPLSGWSVEARDLAVKQLVAIVREEIELHFARKQISLKLNQAESPVTWIEDLFTTARERSQGRVEQHLVGAKLERRLGEKEVKGHATFAADQQTERAGDFAVDNIVFHVTANPGAAVIEKCEDNLRRGLLPVLVIPRDKMERAKGIASATQGLERRISFVAIEDFVASNIIELAGAENSSFFEVLTSVIALYNQRIVQSETDKSLRIELG